MIDYYLLVKTIHIISSTILFGTGLGLAFFLYYANKHGNLAAKAYAAKTVVIADFIFTLPAVIIQPTSGILLIHFAAYDYFETWLIWTYVIYIIAGICWLPVLWIQIRLRSMALEALKNNNELPTDYYKLFNLWFWLGWPAFMGIIAVFFLMVFKPV